MPAQVPGCVQLDLLAQGLLDDPYAGNEKATHDIESKEWEYKCSFDLSEPPEQYDAATIIFDGLDTYAEIRLNGGHIGKTENALIPHRLDCLVQDKNSDNRGEITWNGTLIGFG